MMSANQPAPGLMDRLPAVRGTLQADAPMAKYSWFKTGGAADALFQPTDAADLAGFLAGKPDDVPVTVLGTASNIIIRDGGIEGVVIRIGTGFADIEIIGDTITAGAAAADISVARKARDAGLAGLEFLSGIPGTIGGGLRMNAGAYGAEFKDIFVAAEALDGRGGAHQLGLSDMAFGYRHCGVADDWVFTAATIRGVPGDREAITRRMNEIQTEREATQPVHTPTGGSTFRNPDGVKAWELIEQAGCRGLMRGKAQVSDLHCNFLINTGEATAADLEGLGEEVRRRVHDHSGVTLEWEIRRIGRNEGGLT
ncbi:MAG: UDP-N-acetylmuramate dehydrogenase [Alphaproteobacteria bacterium]|jgi:UDP-N-acetylmuramate dehydrogenase|nr:UDP-N-acetylmuramate dehydrogenase [Alphaproteobacteria bacterium]